MKKLPVPKQNINPLYSSDDNGLRKSIPLKISSILKSSNVITNKKTLAQVTVQYELDKLKASHQKAKTPLIKINEDKVNNTNLFTKNSRNSINIAPNFMKEKSLISKISQNKKIHQNPCNQEDQLNGKLMELIKMITADENNKLNRCHSSITLNLMTPTAHQKKIGSRIQKQIPLPSPIQNTETFNFPQTQQIRVKSPSFLFKPTQNIRYFEPIQQPTRKQLTKSSYFQSPSNLRVNQQRMSHYQPSKKLQTQQFRLCINCESYVNTNSLSEHQKQCLGFNIILRMPTEELIDFLNGKISDKLNQLKQVQSKISQLKSSGSQLDLTQMKDLCQKRSKTDQILNDLDAIRLKALKRFHTKNSQIKKSQS